MTTITIEDPHIKIKPSKQLLELLYKHSEHIKEMPENVLNVLRQANYEIHTNIEILTVENVSLPKINLNLLQNLCKNAKHELSTENIIKNSNEEEKETEDKDNYLYLNDLVWLNTILKRLREEHGLDVFLHTLLETCELQLPKNAVLERNPVLEARCQRLRDEQQNREYFKMTKNVDSALKYYPEDTIAYQMKSLNSQIIAVFQFVISVITGFIFGFLGIQLLIGNLDFGFRLLLGIMCALIVALAEMYFLAKKLNEYDDIASTNVYQEKATGRNKKLHAD